MNTLTDKVAIVTGASSGIGRETALLFASQGAKIIATARRKPDLDELIAQIKNNGGTAIAHVGDTKDETCARTLTNLAIEEFGGLDIAFNNAGTLGDLGPIEEMSLESWNNTLATNLTSGFLNAKYQIPAMKARGQGSIIFTSSFVGHTVGMPNMAAYAASKAGLIALTQTLAAEHGSDNIRVNALLPGGTNTDMGAAVANTPEIQSFVENLHALKRTASPQEIAQSALYLASDASSFTTGTAMLVDGGVSITRT